MDLNKYENRDILAYIRVGRNGFAYNERLEGINFMGRYKFMEYAVNSCANRGFYDYSSKVVKLPFDNKNKFKEFWRSMFLFETTAPTEEDPMFGNFYIESDASDFNLNRDIIIEATEHIHKKYEIPYDFFDYFLTNRSIWLTIPAKVFACYGSKKLNLIYKEMAKEVYSHLEKEGYKNSLDLSIYKWNGLIHGLGSYLKNSRRWVTKFTFYDLEYANTIEDLLIAKYDNCFTFEDIKVVDKAKEWYSNAKNTVFGIKQNKNNMISNCFGCEKKCMRNLEEKGCVSQNRNLHVYSYSLYLKEQGYSLEEALEKVKSTFKMDYVQLMESDRTVKSAIEGNKNLNCKVIKNLLDEDLFDCDNCEFNKRKNKNTFIVPRYFIELLNKNKANHHVYKLLLEILYSYQIEDKNYIYNLNGDKYKKNTISYFDMLKNLNIINYEIVDDKIKTSIVFYNDNTYKSYLLIPTKFIKSKAYFKINREIKLLLELWRCSFLTNNNLLCFNVKLQTLVRNLNSTMKTIIKYLNTLKRLKLIIGRFLLPFLNKQDIKLFIKNMISKIKSNTSQVFKLISEKFKPVLNIKEDVNIDLLKTNLWFKLYSCPLIVSYS